MLPDARDVAEQLIDGVGVGLRLVLAEDVKQYLPAAERHAEQQIGVVFAQVLVDEAAGHTGQCGPVDLRRHLLRQCGAQEALHLLGIGEHLAEQVVVRLGHGTPLQEPWPRAGNAPAPSLRCPGIAGGHA
jgi:hypothetical protein